MRQTPPTILGGEDRLWASSLADDLSFLIARANAISLSAGNAALAPLGLKARSYAVLALASSEGRPTQRELAAFLRLDPSQIVALVDDLEGRGLVLREADPTDRRANVVVATEDGRALCARARSAAERAERQAHAALSEADRLHLARLLRAVAE